MEPVELGLDQSELLFGALEGGSDGVDAGGASQFSTVTDPRAEDDG